MVPMEYHSPSFALYLDDIFLRPWQVEDAGWYVTARDAEVFAWTTERPELTVAETEAAIRQVNASPDVVCFAIADCQTLALLGNLALALEPGKPVSAEIMYWMAPAGRGRGAATKAVKVACDWAFQTLGLERITLKTLPGNFKSQNVARRAGFRPVPDLPTEDAIWFERLRDDP